ncbi:MAG: transposase [Candidatus Hydrogenedentes bacterium]|nr:transposase [Candidatus Hydrogenedentota bacterium]
MPRTARIVVPGAAHHITQRGHNRGVVFHDDADRSEYLILLKRHATESGCRIAGYCLMTNHIHLAAIPKDEDGLAAMMGMLNTCYTRHFNDRHGRSGAVWQGRFYSCPMDQQHAVNALCYVELNPLRAGMVESPAAYPWSSARAHLGCLRNDPVLDLSRWREHWTAQAWQETLCAFIERMDAAEEIRRHTRTGRALGDAKFLKRVATLTDASK